MALPPKRKKKKVFHGTMASDIGNYMPPIWELLKLDNPRYFDEYHAALNYATVVLDKAILKKETIKYLDLPKKDLAAMKAIDEWRFYGVGKQCWFLNNGAELGASSMERVVRLTDELKAMAAEAAKTLVVVEDPTKKAYKPSIQDRIKDQVDALIGGIETEVDKFTTGNYKSDFNPYEYLQAQGVKAMQANQVAQYYQALLDELNAVKGKKDDQLNEGYKFMKPRQLTHFIKFVQGIVDDAQMMMKSAKVARKPRKAKVKSAVQVTANMKYKKEDTKFKLVSLPPEEIVGATQIWVFNAKYSALGVYNTANGDTLTVKGTTIQAFDPENSIGKKVKKPDEVLPKLMKGGKIIPRKLMDEIDTKPGQLTGRVNKDTLIVRVVK